MAYSLVDGASSHLFSFIFRCNSKAENHHWRTSLKLKDPASIEASQANFHHSLTPLLMNYFSLSEIKVLGISKWQTMFFQMNFWTFVAEMVAIGSGSIYFVKWSMPTRRNFTCPFAGEKVQVCLLPKRRKAMKPLHCVILHPVGDICFQIFSILQIFYFVSSHCRPVVSNTKYLGSH